MPEYFVIMNVAISWFGIELNYIRVCWFQHCTAVIPLTVSHYKHFWEVP